MAYTPEQIESVFESICKEIEEGSSLIAILRRSDTPGTQTFYQWLEASEDKQKRYARACERRQEALFEEIHVIADTPVEGLTITTDDKGKSTETKGDMLGHRRLQIDVRKWMLGKMNPKKYGDKLINENHNTNVNVELSNDEFKSLSDELDSEY
jgi:hypothetical protein